MNPGKWLIIAGLILTGLGFLVFLAEKLHLPLGRLPGDIVFQKGNFHFYFPVVTSLLASLVITLLMRFFSRR